ncbi:unnamed protein product, partial [Rotaria sp. Silwood1]
MRWNNKQNKHKPYVN